MIRENQLDRRELLALLTSFGAMGTLSFLLSGCGPATLQLGLRKVWGDVLINGKPAPSKNLTEGDGLKIPNNSTLSTGSKGLVMFVIGQDAFLLRKNSELALTPSKSSPNEIAGFQLNSGGVLSVFAKGNRTLRTPAAIIAIRGTGVYLEADDEFTYVCTCYGTSHLQVKDAPDITETVTTEHHDEPRFVYAADQRIAKAPVYNHTDQELILLEELVGRVPPFVNPDGSVKSQYKGGDYGKGKYKGSDYGKGKYKGSDYGY